MKTSHILIIYGLIYFAIAIGLIKSSRKKFTILDIALIKWLVFATLVCFLEMSMIIKHKYMCNESPINESNSLWEKDYTLKETFKPFYWVDVWKEYCKADPRYLDKHSHVLWLETFVGFGTIIPMIYVLMKYLYSSNMKVAAIVAIIIGTVHSYGTILYYAGYHTQFEPDYKKKSLQWWIYMATNFAWILMPILLIAKSITWLI